VTPLTLAEGAAVFLADAEFPKLGGEFVRVHAPGSRSLPLLVDEPELGKDLVAGVEQRRQFASAVDELAFLDLGAS
jgi:hypothetical protein